MVSKKSIDELKLEYEDRKDRREWIKEILQMLMVFVIGAGSGSGLTALTLGTGKVEFASPPVAEIEAEPVAIQPQPLAVPDKFVPPIKVPGDSGYAEPEIEAMLEAGEEPEDLVEDLETFLLEPEPREDSAHE